MTTSRFARCLLFPVFALSLSAQTISAAPGDLDPTFDGDGKVKTDFPGGLSRGYSTARQADGKLVVVGENAGDMFITRRNADGSLDTSFGAGGLVSINFAQNGYGIGRSVLIAPDEKIVVGGSAGVDFAIVRLHKDGSFDNSFDADGIVTTDLGSIEETIVEIALQTDGQIVAFGQTSRNGTRKDFALARYSAAGALDLTFDGDGKVIIDLGQDDDIPGGMALQADGRIVVAGESKAGSVFLQPSDFTLVRLNSDGSPDTTFSGDGIVQTDVSAVFQAGKSDGARDVLVQPDGKIVAGGWNDATDDFTFVRYNTDGSLDTTFDGDGIAFTDFSANNSEIQGIALDSANRIVATGMVNPPNPAFFGIAVARRNANGSPDTSFNGSGRTMITLANNNTSGERGNSVLVQPDGAIVVTGDTAFSGQNSVYVMLRLLDHGALDSSFDGDGVVTPSSGAGGYDVPGGIALQADGRMVVAGHNGRDVTLARYNSDGSLDPNFGVSGKVVTDFTGRQDEGYAIALQPDGRILVVGRSTRPDNFTSDFLVARYNADGSIDSTFDSDGSVTTAFANGSAEARSVAVQGDGKIVVAGKAGSDLALARYNADGSPDTTFDIDGRLTTDFGGNADEGASVFIHGDGRILVGGAAGSVGSSDFVLARYNSDGSPDVTFDMDGNARTNLGGYDFVRDLVVENDGRITAVGTGGSSSVALARYNADGSLDLSFDTDGKMTMSFGSPNNGTALALQADGRILVAGSTFNNSNRDYVLARLNTNGSADTSFGNAGKVTTDFSVQDFATDMLLLPDARIVVVGSVAHGNVTTNLDFGLARYLNDGTIAPSPSPSPSPSATPVPTPSPTASPGASPTPSASPTATPSASPSPTPAKPLQLVNIATRLRVQTGENVLIGGVIVTGSAPKKVIIRAIGPSLSEVFDGALADTTLELYEGDTLLAANDNWKDAQQSEIEATTIPPSHDLESAVVYTLAPGFYTAVMAGKDGGSGIGVIEVYDLEQDAASQLANIASRGFVEAGENVMIGGLIVGGNGTEDARILLRAIGPSLVNGGVADALRDPMLQLFDNNGELVRENDDWQESQQSEIEATTIPPSDPAESAILATLRPGNYTAVVRGKNETTGVGLVEVYSVQ